MYMSDSKMAAVPATSQLEPWLTPRIGMYIHSLQFVTYSPGDHNRVSAPKSRQLLLQNTS